MKRTYLLAALISSLCLAGNLAAEDLVWQINYAKNHLLADVRLNGMPIYRFSDLDDNSGVLMIAPWLREGRNVLSVSLKAKPGDGVDDGSGGMFDRPGFSFSLFTMNRSDSGGLRNQLFRLKLPLDSGDSLALPWRMDFSIFLEKAPPSRLWSEASALDWNASTKSEAQALLARVYDALRKPDAPAYFDLFRWAIVDMYTAFGWMSAELESKARDNLAEVMRSADFKLVDSDPASLSYETVPDSGGVLLAVRGAGGKPVIDAGAFHQDVLFLARIGGKLTIVRN